MPFVQQLEPSQVKRKTHLAPVSNISPIKLASNGASRKHLFSFDDTDIKIKFKKAFATVMESAKNLFI